MKNRVTKNLAFAALLALLALPLVSSMGWAGIVTTSSDLPPDGVYISPAMYHEYLAAGIKLTDPSHDPILEREGGTVIREQGGSAHPGTDPDDEIETFGSTFTATVWQFGTDGYTELGELVLTGDVMVLSHGKWGQTEGTFDTEIIAMNLSGPSPFGFVTVQIDPDLNGGRASTGQTTIVDNADGTFEIDSFFDVFTELSMGGSPWAPSNG